MKFSQSSVLLVSSMLFAASTFGQQLQVATPVPVRALTPHPTVIPLVVSVDADSITVQNGIFSGMKVTQHESDEQKKQRAANVKTYKVTKWTEIKINGHPSKLADIKQGMPVRVTAGVNPEEAASIAAKVDRSILVPVP